MDQCTVARAAAVGVAVVGDGDADLRRCSVERCGDCGVLLQGQARGTLTACHFTGNGLAGLAVSSRSAELSVRMCVAADNAQGLLVFEGGRPFVSNCELSRNAVGGRPPAPGAPGAAWR
jgi:hypothetical protein